MRREQDSINPRTRPDILLLSHEDEGHSYHPYWYGRVLGIFHVNNIIHTGTGPNTRTLHVQRIVFVFVRWFGRDLGYSGGWSTRRLHRVGFLSADSPGAFEFVNPFDIYSRCSHDLGVRLRKNQRAWEISGSKTC